MTAPKDRKSERGEGSWGNVVMLILSLLTVVALFSAYPPFMANFELSDKIQEASRTFSPGQDGDKKAMAFVRHAIEELKLEEYIPEDACTVSSSGGIGGSRTIGCTYTREYKLFPGVIKKWTFKPSATGPTL